MGAVVDLTDEEWGLVEHLFDPPVHRGVKGTIPRRDIVDAILWVARTGCQWRYLPARFPDWQAVWSQWRRWRDKGTWAAAMRVLAREIRLRHNRRADPTMVMIDGQTVKGGRAGPTGRRAAWPTRPIRPAAARGSRSGSSASPRACSRPGRRPRGRRWRGVVADVPAAVPGRSAPRYSSAKSGRSEPAAPSRMKTGIVPSGTSQGTSPGPVNPLPVQASIQRPAGR
jgi:transposase